jgi:hypothetical protein
MFQGRNVRLAGSGAMSDDQIFVTARIAKRVSDDGLLEVVAEVPDDRVFRMYPETAHLMDWKNRDTGRVIEKMGVWVTCESEGGWFPMELLKIEWN